MILVTGGAGFIGSHLCDRLLKEGYEVLCLDNFNDFYDPKLKEQNIREAKKHSKFTLIRGDILDKKLLQRIFKTHNIGQVVHLAAIAGTRASIATPLAYIDIDIKGTVNLLEATKAKRIKQFIFGSSSSVYGFNKKIPFSESFSPIAQQASPYAVAKLAGELYCKTYHRLYGIPTTVLRFFTVYGPRQRPDMAIRKFTQLMLQHKEIPMFGDGSSQRDYTYIDDCINGILSALRTPLEFEIFNIGRGKTITLKELIELISKKTGVSPKIKRLPDQPGDVPITHADISKAQKMLGYSPKTQIEEGLEKFIRWYK